jgi:hypothetical protein
MSPLNPVTCAEISDDDRVYWDDIDAIREAEYPMLQGLSWRMFTMCIPADRTSQEQYTWTTLAQHCMQSRWSRASPRP